MFSENGGELFREAMYVGDGHPKDKTPDLNKCGVIYEIQCPECDKNYVGETARPLSTRVKEHLNPRAPLTAVGEHSQQEGHSIKEENVKIIGREEHMWRRKIQESIEIRTRQPTLNRDQGYELPRIWDQLLSHDRRPVVM